MALPVCPACYHGAHGHCEGQGCYCDCQIEDALLAEQRATQDYEAEYGRIEDDPEERTHDNQD